MSQENQVAATRPSEPCSEITGHAFQRGQTVLSPKVSTSQAKVNKVISLPLTGIGLDMDI